MLEVLGKLTLIEPDQWLANQKASELAEHLYVRSEYGVIYQISCLTKEPFVAVSQLKHFLYEDDENNSRIGFSFEQLIRINLDQYLKETTPEKRLAEIVATIDHFAKPTPMTFRNGDRETFERLCQAISDCLDVTIEFYTGMAGKMPTARIQSRKTQSVPAGATRMLNAIIGWYRPEQSRPTSFGGGLSIRIPVRRYFSAQEMTAHDRAAAAKLFMNFLITSDSEPLSEKRRKNLVSLICGANPK